MGYFSSRISWEHISNEDPYLTMSYKWDDSTWSQFPVGLLEVETWRLMPSQYHHDI